MVSESDLFAAVAAGWSEAEVTWELKQESAAALAAEGGYDEAAPLWAEALYLAQMNFAKDDPRLATSLANHAFALRRRGDEKSARELFEQSQRVWGSSALWIDALNIESKARSSLFHLRLEVLHRDAYTKTARTRLHRFAAEARAAVAALADGTTPEKSGFSRWKGEKPPTYSDSRKLMAAALLVASG